MTDRHNHPTQPDRDPDAALRERILEQATRRTTDIIDRLTVAVTDLGDGRHFAALGALDGIERDVNTVRSILLLLS